MNKQLLSGMAVASLAQAVGHFFPLAEPHKPPTPTRRILGYTGGCLGLRGGLAAALDRDATLKAAAITTAAGAATVGAYAIDRLLNLIMRQRVYGDGCDQ